VSLSHLGQNWAKMAPEGHRVVVGWIEGARMGRLRALWLRAAHGSSRSARSTFNSSASSPDLHLLCQLATLRWNTGGRQAKLAGSARPLTRSSGWLTIMMMNKIEIDSNDTQERVSLSLNSPDPTFDWQFEFNLKTTTTTNWLVNLSSNYNQPR